MNEGFSREGDTLDSGVSTGVVEKRGSLYPFGDAKLGQGRENCKQFLDQKTALAKAMDHQIRVALSLIASRKQTQVRIDLTVRLRRTTA